MTTAISGPTVAPGALQFDSISPASPFPRVARLGSERNTAALEGSFGTLLGRVELPASALTSTAYPPRLRLTTHAHTAAFLLFVRDGGFLEQHGKATESLDRLSCMYRPAFDEHSNEFTERGAVLAAIDLSPEWVDRLRDAGFSGERFCLHTPFVQQFGDRLEAELAAPDNMSEIVIESLAAEVVVFATRTARRGFGRRGAWPERARRLIEEQFASPLSLSSVAAEVGVHPVHLARQFRAAHGCTVGDYIRRVRIEFARRELAMTDKPIAEIALSTGFFDQSQLTKTFKRITGRTPATYRMLHR